MIREYLNKLKYLRKNIIWLPLQSLNLPKIPDVKGALILCITYGLAPIEGIMK